MHFESVKSICFVIYFGYRLHIFCETVFFCGRYGCIPQVQIHRIFPWDLDVRRARSHVMASEAVFEPSILRWKAMV